MKTKLLFISLISFVFGNAQILTETFQGTTFPPTGWTTGTNVASRPWDLPLPYLMQPDKQHSISMVENLPL